MNYYISDTHFGHSNVIMFDNRPFRDRGEMESVLIANWNRKVGKDDHVYILGDFSYKSDKDPYEYIKQLNGHKHLIIGNHDKRCIMQDEKALAELESADEMLIIKDRIYRLCLCHYPIAAWDGSTHGTVHLYGHIHGRTNAIYRFMRTRPNCYNAGCMINNYEPVTLTELVHNNRRFDAMASTKDPDDEKLSMVLDIKD